MSLMNYFYEIWAKKIETQINLQSKGSEENRKNRIICRLKELEKKVE